MSSTLGTARAGDDPACTPGGVQQAVLLGAGSAAGGPGVL